jgi:hypothetical protein
MQTLHVMLLAMHAVDHIAAAYRDYVSYKACSNTPPHSYIKKKSKWETTPSYVPSGLHE